ncbi:MAG: hypothetical protein WCP18_00195 [bacterium]
MMNKKLLTFLGIALIVLGFLLSSHSALALVCTTNTTKSGFYCSSLQNKSWCGNGTLNCDYEPVCSGANQTFTSSDCNSCTCSCTSGYTMCAGDCKISTGDCLPGQQWSPCMGKCVCDSNHCSNNGTCNIVIGSSCTVAFKPGHYNSSCSCVFETPPALLNINDANIYDLILNQGLTVLATTTLAGTNTFATTTVSNLTVNNLCLNNGCNSDWPISGGSNVWVSSGNIIYPTSTVSSVNIGTTTSFVNSRFNVLGNISAISNNYIANSGVGLYLGTFIENNGYVYGGSIIKNINTTNGDGNGFTLPRLGFFTSGVVNGSPAQIAERMSILSGGFVGIGTTTPDSLLTVVGSSWPSATVRLSNGTNTASILKVENDNGAFAELDTAGSGSNIYGLAPGDSILWAKNNLQFGAGGARDARLSISSNGNVGIGTTTPIAKLVVQTTAPSDGIALSDGSKYRAFLANNNSNGAIFGLNENTTLVVRLESNNTSYINNGYNFGIGTTDPKTKLDVQGGIVSANGYNLSDSATDNLLVNGDFEMNNMSGWSGNGVVTSTAGSYSGKYAMQITGSQQILSDDYIPVDPTRDIFQLDAWVKKTVIGGGLYFGYIAYNADKVEITTPPCGTYCYSAAAAYVVPVDSSWHKFSSTMVGEGTVFPNFPVGTKYIRVLGLMNYGGTGGPITLLDHVTLKRLVKGPLIAGNNFSSTGLVDQNQYSTLYTTASNNLIIGSPGNVGIGTTTPESKLHVAGQISTAPSLSGLAGAGLGLQFSNSLKIGIGSDPVSPYGGWFQVSNGIGSSFPLLLNPLGGNVGIGTTTPANKLTVQGGVQIVDGSQANGKVLTSDANGLASWQPAGGIINDVYLYNGARIITVSTTKNNYFFGGAGNTAMTGVNNMANGNGALLFNVSGRDNLANGFGALTNNVSGSNNVANGSGALYNNIIGSGNSAFGYNSLYNSLGGTNIAIGNYSGAGLQNGSSNIFLGSSAQVFNNPGDPNTIIIPTNSIAIGTNATIGVTTTAGITNAIAIGANTVAMASNTMVLGNGVSVGIGTNNPSAKLDVRGGTLVFGNIYSIANFNDGSQLAGNGKGLVVGYDSSKQSTVFWANSVGPSSNFAFWTYDSDSTTWAERMTISGSGAVSIPGALAVDSFKLATGASVGNVMTSDVSGNASWLPPSGGIVNDVYSYNSKNIMVVSTTRDSYFFGGAGNTTMTGNGNTGSGMYSLSYDTTGGFNTAYGYGALYQNTTGGNNVAVGATALSNNTSGSGNVGIGFKALMLFNSTSGGNVGIGNNAGMGMVKGASNIFLGENAQVYNEAIGNTNINPTNSIAIGSLAQIGNALTTNIDNATAIGYGALAVASNTMVLGNGAISVGIGTSTPQNALHVYSATGQSYISADAPANRVAGFNIRENGVVKWYISKSNTTTPAIQNGALNFATSSGNVMTLAQNGNVGIGTSTPASTLDVKGTVRIENRNVVPAVGMGWVVCYVRGTNELGHCTGTVSGGGQCACVSNTPAK